MEPRIVNRNEADNSEGRDDQTYAIIGAAMEVHKELGCGFLEAVYQEAFAVELSERGIPFRRECVLPIKYKGSLLETHYRADFCAMIRLSSN